MLDAYPNFRLDDSEVDRPVHSGAGDQQARDPREGYAFVYLSFLLFSHSHTLFRISLNPYSLHNATTNFTPSV